MKKFAVVLAGCGVFDGAEIHEATLTLLAIVKNGCSYEVFAPDRTQHHVVNHLTGKEMPESRNVLVESSRIARGKAHPMEEFDPDDFDALIFPGGFGVAKNLITWAIDGDQCRVDESVEKALRSMKMANKPIGAMCISPVLLAKIFPGIKLTTGNDHISADFIRKMGSEYVVATHAEVIVDKQAKIFTTPCYMLDAAITDIEKGTDNLVKEMLKVM